MDASVTLAWHFVDEKRPETDGLAKRAEREGVVVPQHWPIEVGNSLLVGEKRNRTNADLIDRFLKELRNIRFVREITETEEVFGSILHLAREQKLTTYDASYLYLAIRFQLALATLDKMLANAAQAKGVEILPA